MFEWLKGSWGDRLGALFDLGRPIQWLLAKIIIPTVDVTPFVVRRTWAVATASSTDNIQLPVPSGKRWVVSWVELRTSVSAQMSLFLWSNAAGTYQIQTHSVASGTRAYYPVDCVLEGGDVIRGSTGAAGNLVLNALVLEYDVEL